MEAYYPGLTETTREEADVVRCSLAGGSEKYYKISDPTYSTTTRTLNGWFPATFPNSLDETNIMGEENVFPNEVFGPDDRTKFLNTHQSPYSAVGLIVAEFENNIKMRYETYESSGAMIGRNNIGLQVFFPEV